MGVIRRHPLGVHSFQRTNGAVDFRLTEQSDRPSDRIRPETPCTFERNLPLWLIQLLGSRHHLCFDIQENTII